MKKFMMTAVMGLAILSGTEEMTVRGEESDTVIKRRLDSMVLSVDFQDVSLAEAVSYLQEASGINIVISPEVRRLGEDLRCSLKVRDLRLRSILTLMLDGARLHAVLEHGVVSIVTGENLKERVVLRLHEVRDLQLRIEDFPGPDLELNYEDEQVGVVIIQALPPEPVFTDDLLLDLVRTMTGGNSWRENDNTGISIHNGRLVVTQTPEVQDQIALLLAKLRQYQ